MIQDSHYVRNGIIEVKCNAKIGTYLCKNINTFFWEHNFEGVNFIFVTEIQFNYYFCILTNIKI